MALHSSAGAKALHDRMLGKKLWVVTTKAVGSREQLDQHLEAHLRHQISLEKAGIMFGAGPLANADGTPSGTGMIIIRAETAEAARAIADLDPFHSSGLRTYTLQQWTMNEGRLTITLDFSDQSYTLA